MTLYPSSLPETDTKGTSKHRARKKIRAQGRKHYIVYTGILRWGMSVFILTTLWSWYEEYGWRVPPHGDLWFSVILGLIIWSVAGYFWGSLHVEAAF